MLFKDNNLNRVVNAPSATSYGVELEVQALPVDDLLLDLSFGWLEAFYDEQFLSADSTRVTDFGAAPVTEVIVDLDDNRLPRSPRFTLAVGAQYTLELGRFGSLTPRVDFYFRDEISFRQFDNPNDEQEAFTRTDLRLTWRSEDARLFAELFMRNVEDEAVKTNQELQNAVYRVHYYDRPRSGGFRIGYAY